MSVAVVAKGREFTGWQTASIDLGIDQVAGAFDLSVTTRLGAGQFPLALGDSVTVKVYDEPVITGHIEQRGPRYTKKDGRTVRIGGRDATGDLIKSSAIHGSGQWRNATLERIGRDLLAPFAIRPIFEPGLSMKALPEFIIEQGETVLQALVRAASYDAALLYSDGLGALIFGKPGSETISTVLRPGDGGNVLELDGEETDVDRNSEYIIRGERDVSDWMNPGAVVRVEGRAKDPSISRYCPLIVVADAPASDANLATRAEHIAAVRFGRSTSYTYKVSGWRHETGLWRPNVRVRVEDPEAPLFATLLISRVRLILSKDEGEIAEVTLVPPQTYERLAKALPAPTEPEYEW